MLGPAGHARLVRRLAVALLAALLAVTPATAQRAGLDLPEQIGTGERSVMPPDTDGRQTAPRGQFRIDDIPTDAGDRTRVQQPQGTRDLCGPETSDAERRRLGVVCPSEPLPGAAGQRAARPGTRDDPLLTPRDEDARQEFRSLGLGDDVPATVILQP
jgi:hypothetical protein